LKTLAAALTSKDEALVLWLVQQVRERGLQAVAERLNYDAANLAKVVAGKRGLSRGVRTLVVDQRCVKENNPV
jgi:predicted chitinase